MSRSNTVTARTTVEYIGAFLAGLVVMSVVAMVMTFFTPVIFNPATGTLENNQMRDILAACVTLVLYGGVAVLITMLAAPRPVPGRTLGWIGVLAGLSGWLILTMFSWLTPYVYMNQLTDIVLNILGVCVVGAIYVAVLNVAKKGPVKKAGRAVRKAAKA